jgi:hypothetical protein
MNGSELERAFDTYWRIFAPDMPEPKEEHQFSKWRNWRFDRAWVAEKVAVELEGGLYTRGRHQRPKGFSDDCDKYNMASLEGWIVLRYTVVQMDDPEGMIAQVRRAIESRRAGVV